MPVNYFLLLLICCVPNIQVENTSSTTSIETTSPLPECIYEEHSKTRVFHSISHYKSNDISFSPSFSPFAKGYKGQLVAFDIDKIYHISEDGFRTFTSQYVSSLDLNQKFIKEIDNGAFLNYFCLRNLNLGGNLLKELHQGLFKGLDNLQTLNLSSNVIYTISNNSFDGLNSLVSLNLSKNHLVVIEPHGLNNLPLLERLLMSRNSVLDYKYPVFDNLTSLKELDISWNRVEDFEADLFIYLNQLERLDLSGNMASWFRLGPSTETLENVVFLNLSVNGLTKLHMPSVKKRFPNNDILIDINTNSFQCKELEIILYDARQMKTKLAPGRYYSHNKHVDHRENIQCYLPREKPVLTTKSPKPTKSDVDDHPFNKSWWKTIFTVTVYSVGIITGGTLFWAVDRCLGTNLFRRCYSTLLRWHAPPRPPYDDGPADIPLRNVENPRFRGRSVSHQRFSIPESSSSTSRF